MNFTMLERWQPQMLAILRIMTGLLFLEHGTQKLFAFPPNPASPPPALSSLSGVQGIIEFVGGLLIIGGVFTRPVSFILAGDMAVAYFMAHAPRGFFPINMGGNGGELAIMYCFVFLYLMVAGAGAWSFDATRQPWRSKY